MKICKYCYQTNCTEKDPHTRCHKEGCGEILIISTCYYEYTGFPYVDHFHCNKDDCRITNKVHFHNCRFPDCILDKDNHEHCSMENCDLVIGLHKHCEKCYFIEERVGNNFFTHMHCDICDITRTHYHCKFSSCSYVTDEYYRFRHHIDIDSPDHKCD